MRLFLKKETLIGLGAYMSLFFIVMLAFGLFNEWGAAASVFAMALFALSGVLISPFLKHFGKMLIKTANKFNILNKKVGTTMTVVIILGITTIAIILLIHLMHGGGIIVPVYQ